MTVSGLGTKNLRSHNKRNDIQVLRFVAIAAVLGFHLRPKSIPQGYLGVDMFFVISGYLMTVITASTKGVLTVKNVLQFYERRLKRLCPVYIFTLFWVISAGKFILIATDYESLRSDTFWALFFGTNIQSMVAREDYFQLVSSYKLLLHTWSLSVEVQYYVVAPFLLLFIYQSRYPLLTCAIISVLSFLFQALIPWQTWSFGCVLARIWQFLIGTFVFYFEKRRYELKKHVSGNVFAFLATMFVVTLLLTPELSQKNVYKTGLRFLATSLTGVLLYYGPTVSDVKSFKRPIDLMALIGDASYSIYLVHWSMIIFAQYVDIYDYMNIFTQTMCILLAAFTQYYFYEKPIITLPTSRIFYICAVFLLSTLAVLCTSYNNEIPKFSIKTDVRKMDPVLANQQINKDCDKKYLECPHVPEFDAIVPNTTTNAAFFCGFKGHGSLNVFVTGNSYALHQLEAVQKALDGQFKTLYFAARPGCLAFDGMNQFYPKRFGCAEVVGLTEKILSTLKPDVMIIIQRIDNHYAFKSGTHTIGNVTTVEYLETVFADYSKHTKKIFVVEPNSVVGYNVPLFLAKKLQHQQPIESAFITLDRHKHAIDSTMNHVVNAMKSCPKCETIWIRDHLCHAEKCLLYEKGSNLGKYCDNAHLSTIGIDAIMPAFRVALKRAFQEINNS